MGTSSRFSTNRDAIESVVAFDSRLVVRVDNWEVDGFGRAVGLYSTNKAI